MRYLLNNRWRVKGLQAIPTMPLSKSELQAFLDQPRMAHLATSSRDGKPRVTPIWYIYENGLFYFSTRLGRLKGHHIMRNPSVSLSVANDEHPYVAVSVFGKAQIVKKDRDKWMERLAKRYREPDVKSYLAHSTPQPDRVVMAIRPERVMSWHYGRDDAERQDEGKSMATET
jgi:PPOX class probable F420-dependent enzyme